jgi:hypothetical protein
MKIKPQNSDGEITAVIVEALKKQFPQVPDLELIKFLNTQNTQYFWLTPLEFAKMEDRCLKQLLENIKTMSFQQLKD